MKLLMLHTEHLKQPWTSSAGGITFSVLSKTGRNRGQQKNYREYREGQQTDRNRGQKKRSCQ
jgi:hypothetical protein